MTLSSCIIVLLYRPGSNGQSIYLSLLSALIYMRNSSSSQFMQASYWENTSLLATPSPEKGHSFYLVCPVQGVQILFPNVTQGVEIFCLLEEKSHSSWGQLLYEFMSSCWQNCVGKDGPGTGLYVLFSKSDEGSYTLARRGMNTRLDMKAVMMDLASG